MLCPSKQEDRPVIADQRDTQMKVVLAFHEKSTGLRTDVSDEPETSARFENEHFSADTNKLLFHRSSELGTVERENIAIELLSIDFVEDSSLHVRKLMSEISICLVNCQSASDIV